jgi:hypothetical protein
VLDAGCGYGDLITFLCAHYNLSHYCGVEQIPELFAEAITRHGDRDHTLFISGNFLDDGLPIADYVLASGSLNYANSDPAFIFKAISTLFAHCRHGLGFNLLRTIPENDLLVAYDPALILVHCRTLSKRVVVQEDYADEDFTVWLYRD